MPRSYIERDHDQAQAVKLALMGVGQAEIAKQLGVSQTTVCRDLRRARTQWADASNAALDEIRAGEVLMLDHVQHEALRSWEKAKRTGQHIQAARLLDVVVKCSARKAKLLGLDRDPNTPVGSRLAYDDASLEIRLSKYQAIFTVTAPEQDDANVIEAQISAPQSGS